MSALAALRSATGPDHAAVDAAFGGFDLADPAAYGRFLSAHARALPAVEAVLAPIAAIPAIRPRAPLLAADLAALGLPVPDALPVAAPAGAAEAFGMAYVIEGSRLGGGLLARRVAPALPRAYLTATHTPGEWRDFGRAIDGAAGGDEAWIARAVWAAKRVFGLYAQAAST